MSVDPWDPELAQWADKVAFSVPMHTATRMARELAADIDAADLLLRAVRGHVRRHRRCRHRGRVRERPRRLGRARHRPGHRPARPHRARRPARPLPARGLLPSLDRYAHLVDGDTSRTVGSVEASRGCAHRCRHCPVPVVYDGRVRVTDEAAVLADIEQLVTAGATHITFGDPDFLNAPQHSMRVVRAMHAPFPAAHVRLHGEGRARAALHRPVVGAGRRRLHLRGVGIRVGERHDPRAPRQGSHRVRIGGRRVSPPLLRDRRATVVPAVHTVDDRRRRDRAARLRARARSDRQRRPGAVLDPPAPAPRFAAARPSRPRAVPRRVGRRSTHVYMVVSRPVGRRAPAGVRHDRGGRRRHGRALPPRRTPRLRAAAGAPPADTSQTRLDRPHLSESWFCCAEPTEAQVVRLRS